MTFSRALLGAVLGIAVLTLPAVAAANDRHFTYTYETAVLPPGARELEVWTTWRAGRERYYSRFDHRLELEVGVAKNRNGRVGVVDLWCDIGANAIRNAAYGR